MQGMNRCQRCGTQNQPGQPFCGNCGAPLSALCPACGAGLEPGAAFCGNCGAQVGTGGSPQGWGQPPQGAQQQGWGQPPQGAQQQGWGQPPQGAQQGWGQPPQSAGPYGPYQGRGMPGQQPPYGSYPPKKKGTSSWTIAFVGIIAIALLAVGVLYATGHLNLGQKNTPGSQSTPSAGANNNNSSSSGSQTAAQPHISDIAADADENEATITWTTDKACTSQVKYGESTDFENFTDEDTELVTEHSVLISGLLSGTLYYFRVESEDEEGNRAVSANDTFTTVAVEAGTQGQVEILNHAKDEQTFEGGGDNVLTVIKGQIKNSGTVNVYSPYVIVKVTYKAAYDGTEKEAEGGLTRLMPESMKPGETRDFEVYIPEKTAGSYDISASIEAST